MPAIDDFVRHPRTFMRANVVMVQGGTGGIGGIKTFSFRRAAGITAVNVTDGDRAMDVYVMKLGDGTQPQVSAYWCPYSKNDFLGTTLPGTGGPNMMFTYAMDGCTFAAGSVTADKSVTVHHVNMTEAANLGLGVSQSVKDENQRKLQRNIAKSLVTDARLVDPDDYYVAEKFPVVIPPMAKISTVTFGRRTATGWKFYTHQWYTVEGARLAFKFLGTKRII